MRWIARPFARMSRGLLVGTLVAAVPAVNSSRVVVASATPPRLTYSSDATINSTGMSGPQAVQFLGGSGTVAAGMPFSLGSFVVNAASDGSITQYNMTPVTIWYQTQAINGVSTAGKDGMFAAPMEIHGWLEGRAGAGLNGVSLILDQGIQPDDPAYYQPRLLPPLPASSGIGASDGTSPLGTLSLDYRHSVLNLGSDGEPAELDAEVNLTPSVPEPASYLIFLGGAITLLMVGRRQSNISASVRS